LYQYFYILVKNLFFTNFKNSINTEKIFSVHKSSV